jgi:hypothetical protein
MDRFKELERSADSDRILLIPLIVAIPGLVTNRIHEAIRNSTARFFVAALENGVPLMTRTLGILSAAIVASHLVCTGAFAAPTTEKHHSSPPPARLDGDIGNPAHARAVVASRLPVIRHQPRKVAVKILSQPTQAPIQPADMLADASPRPNDNAAIEPTPGAQTAASRSPVVHHRVRKVTVQARAQTRPEAPDLPPLPADTLSPQARQVSQIARRAGEREFLMVDKPFGRIILFQNGQPVYMGAALTGESTSDSLPPGALSEKFAQLVDLEDKVTPAGRFTVTPGYDKNYGPLLDVNEIQGKDWAIAIHQVYLGIPSENRAARLQSPNDEDKHITYGCINVAPETIRVLIRELPKDRRTTLYVLPQDGTKTAVYFSPHDS